MLVLFIVLLIYVLILHHFFLFVKNIFKLFLLHDSFYVIITFALNLYN